MVVLGGWLFLMCEVPLSKKEINFDERELYARAKEIKAERERERESLCVCV